MSWWISRAGRPPARIALAAMGLAIGSTSLALAQGPGRLDSHIGAVVAGSRAIGLGGAVCAIAEGADTEAVNPAAVAVRADAFADDWFDWDFHVTALTTVGSGVDLDMSRAASRDTAQTAETLGARLSFGRFAISLYGLVNRYERSAVGEDDVRRGFAFESRVGGIGLGFAFARGQWVVGSMLLFGVASLRETASGAAVHFGSPFAPRSFGVLYAPHDRRYRFGASLLLPVHMTQARAEAFTGEPVTHVGAMTVPSAVEVGMVATVGAAWQLLGHRGNAHYTLGESRPRPRGWRGLPLLMASDLVIYGPVPEGIGVGGYLSGASEASGRGASIGLRAGAETEPFERRLRVRTGAYYEPRRFGGVGHGHFTGGADVRLTVVFDWRIGFVWDLAPGYRNTAFSLGLWH